jgi:hypothetical protein
MSILPYASFHIQWESVAPSPPILIPHRPNVKCIASVLTFLTLLCSIALADFVVFAAFVVDPGFAFTVYQSAPSAH